MFSTNTIAAKPGIIVRLQVKETALVLALSVLITFLIHLLPSYNGIPVGAIFLAMFFAPYFAVKYFKFHVALLTSLAAPFMNYLITGNPRADLIPLLTLQLALFISASKIFSNFSSLKYLDALSSYVVAMVISFLALLAFPVLMSNSSLASYFQSAFVTGLPGILLLVLMNVALIQFNKK